MHRHIIAILLFSLITGTEANEMNWKKLHITIHDIEVERGGEMSVYLFLEKGFPIKHEQAIKHYRFEVSNTTQELLIEAPDQPFALKAHHDEDRSGTVTKNWTGIIPAEGFGFSSGARMRFGPPSFKQAAMTLPNNQATILNMIYP